MSYPLCQESLSALRERDRVNEIWAISMHVRSMMYGAMRYGVYKYHDPKVRAHFISMITPEWHIREYASRPCCVSDYVSSQKGSGFAFEASLNRV